MGNKDVRHREAKKLKKVERRAVTVSPINPTPPVEVIPKRKADKEDSE